MIFVDTGAFVGRYVDGDQHHAAAMAIWDSIAEHSTSTATTSFVLAEAFTLIGRRTTHQFAAERARLIYSSSALKIIRPTVDDEVRALMLFERYGDHSISFVDCISFAVMRRLALTTAFTFDKHFPIAGFTPTP